MSTKIYVRPSELSMPVYQRTPWGRRVNDLATTFDPAALGAITGARRTDGTIVIIDGGHRVAACKLVGYDEKILVIVHDGLSLAEEARLFLALNDMKAVGAVDKYQASVYAEDATAIQIEKTVLDRGWRIHKNVGMGNITAISTINKILRMRKREDESLQLFADALDAITAAWGYDKDGVQGYLLEGVAKVLHRYPEVDQKRLARVLAMQSPNHIKTHGVAIADMSGWHKGSGVAATIVSAYNSRLRTGRLSDWIWKN